MIGMCIVDCGKHRVHDSLQRTPSANIYHLSVHFLPFFRIPLQCM